MALSINPLTVAIIFVAGLALLGLTAWMLNRAWGDFPSRAGQPPAPPMPLPTFTLDKDATGDADEGAPLPAGAVSSNLVEVTHPMVLRAVQQAMERPGSPYATYFIRDGEHVFLVLTRIADPIQRETARRLFTGLNSGSMEDVGMGDLMQMLSQLGKR
jgi:hypothetical protein